MAAYAVTARIGRVEPHLTIHDVDRALAATVPDDVSPTNATVAEVWATDAGPVAAWLIRLRELWTQTTFYLFDPDSWRT